MGKRVGGKKGHERIGRIERNKWGERKAAIKEAGSMKWFIGRREISDKIGGSLSGATSKLCK